MQLDAYDLDRTFGILLPRLAKYSPPLSESLLRISAASSGTRVEGAQNSLTPLTLGIGGVTATNVAPFPALQIVLHFVFLRAQEFLEAGPERWESVFSGSKAPRFNIYEFAAESHRRIWFATATLMSRLGAPSQCVSLQ